MSDLDDAKTLITESGNNFHCKVIEYFRANDWFVSISPYYLDGSTNRPREIDLVAEKAWSYNSVFNKSGAGNVTVKLFIECKYIPKVNVLWFDNIDESSTLKWLSTNLPGNKHKVWLEKHHYVTSGKQVAKLFASQKDKQAENEPIYKAINQSLNSVVNLRNTKSIVPAGTNGFKSSPIYTMEMPVIVCNSFDKMYRTDIGDSAEPKIIGHNFKLELNYAYVDQRKNNKNEYFLIDVLSFDRLDQYLENVEADAILAREMLG